jgi:hypothetical protein
MTDITHEFRLELVRDLHNARSPEDIEAVPAWRDIAFLLNVIDVGLLLEPEPEYEYAIERTIVGPGRPTICGDWWSPRDEVNIGLLDLNTERTHYRLVKRRKAGPVEDAD